MTRTNSLHVMAESSAALVDDYDLTGMLARVTREAGSALGADAAGLLVTNTRAELELLSATSHRAAELEIYQALNGVGPCQECMRLQAVSGFDLEDVAARWPALEELMATRGFRFVLAAPLRWRGEMLGGLNLFFADQSGASEDVQRDAQIYGDLLTLFIVNSRPMDVESARERVEAALAGRVVIEQAKGVLVEREELDPAAAYERLLNEARERGEALTEVARTVVEQAYR